MPAENGFSFIFSDSNTIPLKIRLISN
jgi:hypothetical protein